MAKQVGIITSELCVYSLGNVHDAINTTRVEFGATPQNLYRMALATDHARILTSWHAIELFSAQSVPAPNPRHRTQPVFRVLASEPLPWQTSHALQQRALPAGKVWRHFVYCGLFRSDTTRELLEKHFGANADAFDRPDDAAYCLFAFEVDSNGRPAGGTFALSSLAWALGRTLNPGPNNPDWLTGFVDAEDEATLDFEHRYALRHKESDSSELLEENLEPDADDTVATDTGLTTDDEEATESVEQQEHPLCHEDLIAEVNGCIERLGIRSLIAKPMTRVRSLLMNQRRDDTKNEPVLLNSFFIDDLNFIANHLKKHKTGAALASYLTAPEGLDKSTRVDVRCSTDYVFDTLSPALFPLGRWPEFNGYPLVASQQFAINSTVRSLGSGAGIAAVNGPPGTGKTTLLRDLIANVTVQRAMRLAELKSPKDAFDQSTSWTAGGYKRTIWRWKESFHGHEIVIASSNNGAVENVTLEIPGIGAIDPTAVGDMDHFQELASHILGDDKEAWGLMAAKLGNKANRSEFRNRFWFDRDAGTADCPKLPGMMSILNGYREKTEDWHSAVDTFVAAVDVSERLRTERLRAYEQGVMLRSLIEDVNIQQAKHDDLHTRLLDSEAALAQAIQNETYVRNLLEASTTNRLEHRRFRPGLIEIIFTFGRAFREWKSKDATLKLATNTDEQKLFRATREQAAQAQELSTQQHTYRAAREYLDELKRDVSYVSANQTLLASTLDIEIPDPTSQDWGNDSSREKSAPWADEKWNKARAQVFVAALALHRSFMRANASQMRQSLFAAMDVLDGKVPIDAKADAVANAWRALFLVVPVISTTFASFARLFPQLGSESLGWLLVDEAGQALPQDAVGALWRARRAVIVGDPLQLEPIVTISLKAQDALRRNQNVNETWTPGRSSVQRLADRVSRYGTYVENGEEAVWVGSPLRVHRRCDAPMFDICNITTYSRLMVYGKIDDGNTKSPSDAWPSSRWIDVQSATADGHWIPAEGDETVKLLEQLISLEADPKQIFLISPFRTVADQLRPLTQRFKGIRAGTVHTTQGKEADIVVLVLGSNPTGAGARQWAASKPNLLNVAVSRAKRRLYVIGDLSAWRSCRYFSTCATLLESHMEQETLENVEVES